MNPRCNYNWKFGWRCGRDKAHNGPCALAPLWWNLKHRSSM